MLATLLDHLRHVRRRRTWPADLATGRRGEDLAHRFLKQQGYMIVARNYRLSGGEAEADLIAHEGGELVMVEVKTRESEEFGPPDRAIGPEKQRHLRRVARAYARKAGVEPPGVRCDVVTVVLTDPPRLTLFRSAVDLLKES